MPRTALDQELRIGRLEKDLLIARQNLARMRIAQNAVPSGAQGTARHEAGEAIAALRAVYIRDNLAWKADKDSLYAACGVFGIATETVATGADAILQREGELTSESFNWANAINPTIYLGAAGLLTQSAPTTGYLVRVGFAISTTSMVVGIHAPIRLS